MTQISYKDSSFLAIKYFGVMPPIINFMFYVVVMHKCRTESKNTKYDSIAIQPLRNKSNKWFLN